MPHIDQAIADFLDAHPYSMEDPARFTVAARDFCDDLANPADQRAFLERLIAEMEKRYSQGELRQDDPHRTGQPGSERVLFLLNRELMWMDDQP
jgi:hypothetical protein